MTISVAVHSLLLFLLQRDLQSNEAIAATQIGMAKGLLMLDKGIPDSSGQKCPFSHGRLRKQPVLS